jgi:hypothetical protein
MKLTVLTQPQPLVTLDEAKIALGESGSDRNALITTLILAAQAEMDGPKGWVGISVAEQTAEVRLDSFCDEMQLPAGPVVSPLTSVKYLDSDGVEQTLDDETYVLLTDGRLILADEQSWPATLSTEEAVRVVYDVGISEATDPRVALMKSAILMHVKMTLDMVDPKIYREAIGNLVFPLQALSI